MTLFHNGNIVLPDRVLECGAVIVEGQRIRTTSEQPSVISDARSGDVVDLRGGYLLPGFIDVHVHGARGADFMDGSPEAYATVLRAHARHGTTSLTPTSTVARHDQTLRFLELTRHFRRNPVVDGATVLGAHLYGPYFAESARGCHPAEPVRPPVRDDYQPFLDFADSLRTATVAAELPGAEQFVRDCRALGIRCNVGHSHATFDQMEAAVGWGVRHVDHLFCAMSDRARLRLTQTYPMRGGVMEATLYFDELTTEIITDGMHLNPELMKLAYKVKGPTRLAITTDTMRAMDMPDGEYIFGPADGGEPVRKLNGAGVTLDGKALASGVQGMDHCLRTFIATTGVSLVQAVRMASLTPATIVGVEGERGSIEPGKFADLVVMNRDLMPIETVLAGRRIRVEDGRE